MTSKSGNASTRAPSQSIAQGALPFRRAYARFLLGNLFNVAFLCIVAAVALMGYTGERPTP